MQPRGFFDFVANAIKRGVVPYRGKTEAEMSIQAKSFDQKTLRPSGHSRQYKTEGNDTREYKRYDKEVFPAQKSHHDETDREAPSYDRHRRQLLFGETSELPCQDCNEQQKNRHEKPKTNTKVPIGPVEPLHLEMRRSQRCNN